MIDYRAIGKRTVDEIRGESAYAKAIQALRRDPEYLRLCKVEERAEKARKRYWNCGIKAIKATHPNQLSGYAMALDAVRQEKKGE